MTCFSKIALDNFSLLTFLRSLLFVDPCFPYFSLFLLIFFYFFLSLAADRREGADEVLAVWVAHGDELRAATRRGLAGLGVNGGDGCDNVGWN